MNQIERKLREIPVERTELMAILYEINRLYDEASINPNADFSTDKFVEAVWNHWPQISAALQWGGLLVK